MLTELCAELKNYFLINREDDVHAGVYTISGGSIEALPFLQNGQFFRIVGSVFNDGVYQYPENKLIDERFYGAVWAMAVPPTVIALAADIECWINDHEDAINSPYQSESFGGYSYSRGSYGDNSQGITWQKQFSSRLAPWRKL